MSHIPASAMPHAAPRHADEMGHAEPAPASIAAAEPATPETRPKRGGWRMAALTAGGVALTVGAVALNGRRRA